MGGSFQPPRLERGSRPLIFKFARREKLSGNVEIYLVCEADGPTSDIEIVRPLGLELDEAAVAAVIGYRFAPATENGQPVKVDLYVEVNFQIF